MPYLYEKSCINQAERWIQEKLVFDVAEGLPHNFLKRHVAARAAHLILLPAAVIVALVDIIIKVGAAVVNLCTLGLNKKIYSFAHYTIYSSQDYNIIGLPSGPQYVSKPWSILLKVLNPSAQGLEKNDYPSPTSLIEMCVGRDCRQDLQLRKERFVDAVAEFRSSNNLFRKQVESRLGEALILIVTTVKRIVDTSFIVLASIFALLTLGTFSSLNEFAYNGLQHDDINVILMHTTHSINPWAVGQRTPSRADEHPS